MKISKLKSIIRKETRRVQLAESFKAVVLEELYSIIAEGKLDDLKKQYVDTNKVSLEDFNKLTAIDTTPTKKYIGWILKQWVIADKESKDIGSFIKYVNKYDNAVKGNKTKQKDINTFKSFGDLKNEIDILDISGQLQSKSADAADSVTILDDNNLLIKMPKSHAASRKLGLTDFAFRSCKGGGKDSAWCTTYKTTSHWDDYFYNEHVTFYYTKVKSEELLQQLASIPKLAKTWKNYVVVAFAVVPIQNKKTKEPFMIDAYDGKDTRVPPTILNLVIDTLGIRKYLVPQVDVEERKKGKMQALHKRVISMMQKKKLTEDDSIELKDLPEQFVFPSEFRKAHTIYVKNSSVVFPEMLEAEDVTIFGEKHKIKLPTRLLKVDMLILTGVDSIVDLKAVKTRKRLILRRLKNLENIGKLQLESDFEIRNCPKIKELSDIVAKEAYFHEMTNLQKISTIKTVESVILEDCNRLTTISDITTPILYIKRCENFRQIVNSKIQKIDFDGLTPPPNLDWSTLPAETSIVGVDFSTSKTLPINIPLGERSRSDDDDGFGYANEGRIELPNHLKKLPEGVLFGKYAAIYLDSNSKLEQLPDNIEIGRLKILEGSALQRLPKNLTINTELDLFNKIDVLPASITFANNTQLNIHVVSGLKRIEQNSSVPEVNVYVDWDQPRHAPYLEDIIKSSPELPRLMKKIRANSTIEDNEEFLNRARQIIAEAMQQYFPNAKIDVRYGWRD